MRAGRLKLVLGAVRLFDSLRQRNQEDGGSLAILKQTLPLATMSNRYSSGVQCKEVGVGYLVSFRRMSLLGRRAVGPYAKRLSCGLTVLRTDCLVLGTGWPPGHFVLRIPWAFFYNDEMLA